MSVTAATPISRPADRLIPIADLVRSDEMPDHLAEDDVRAFVRRSLAGALVVVEARRGWQGEREAWFRVAYWRPRWFRTGLAPHVAGHPEFSRAWTLPYAERAWSAR